MAFQSWRREPAFGCCLVIAPESGKTAARGLLPAGIGVFWADGAARAVIYRRLGRPRHRADDAPPTFRQTDHPRPERADPAVSQRADRDRGDDLPKIHSNCSQRASENET